MSPSQTDVHRPSEDHWQSTLVRVIRITLEVVSAKVGESKCLASDSSLLGVLRSYVVAHVLLLSWDGCGLSLRSCPLVPWLLLPRVRALPRSPGGRSCRGVLEPPSPRSLFTHACRVSCAAGQSALLFVIMLALTPASSTPAPFPRALFATLVTSRRRVLERRRREALTQGFLVRRLHLGSSCPSLHAVWLEISAVVVRQHLLSREESTVCRFHDISV